MSGWPRHPLVYEINTLPWLTALSAAAARPLTLAAVPDAELERLAALRFDAVWLMGVWERSPRGREIARTHPDLQAAYEAVLPQWQAEDVAGSPYCVYSYRVDPVLGGDDALAALRERLHARGLRLVLDFVPNHLALDHPWITEHPERFVQAAPDRVAAEPQNYFVHAQGGVRRVFAHGRDPHFGGWTDTVQLDYRRAETRRAMTEALVALGARCDGLRCDMAMLLLREVFLRTWGGDWEAPDCEFWPDAIGGLRTAHPQCLMLAEAYWGLEHRMHEVGFDYAYDKRLYDRLASGSAAAVRSHLRADFDHQRRLTRFIENHDEPRARATFGDTASHAAAVLVMTLPGMRLVYDGQLEGRRLRPPVQLARHARELQDAATRRHYERLLAALADPILRDGRWRLIEPQPAWDGSTLHEGLIGSCWSAAEAHCLTVVNWSMERAHGRLPLMLPASEGASWQLLDRLTGETYVRDGDEMREPGLFVELPAFGAHLFELRRQAMHPAPAGE